MVAHRRLPVYIIHFDAAQWCRSSVGSLLGSTGVEVDVTVVDNGPASGDSLADLLPSSVRVLAAPSNLGYTGAANLAIDDWAARHPDAELCVVGSHDLHVRPDTLARLVAVAEDRPDCGVLAPALTSPVATSGGGPGPNWAQLSLEGAPEMVERHWAVGTCLMLRRKCVDDVGRFDERFGSYTEDVDYGLRVNDRGWKVLVVTSAEAWGLGTASPDAVRSKATNSVLLVAKREGPGAAARALGRLVVRGARGYAASVLPWRDAGRRRRSRTSALQCTGALVELLTTTRLPAVLKDRRRTPALGDDPQRMVLHG